MTEAISHQELTDRLKDLKSHGEWQAALDEQATVATTVPKKFDPNNRSHLTAQMNFLTTVEIQESQRQHMLADIAEQGDGFAPLVHRLGLLAVYDTYESTDHLGGFNMRISSLDKEDQIEPAYSPVKRAVQIGNELLSITGELEKDAPVPVAMVENKYCRNCRVQYSLVASGKIVDTHNALNIEAPEVDRSGSTLEIIYKIPDVIFGVLEPHSFAGHVAIGFYRSEPREYSAAKRKKGEINPPIPRIRKLINGNKGLTRIDALYLGDRAVARIEQAEIFERAIMSPTPRSASRRRRRR